MKLYAAKVDGIAKEIVTDLTSAGDIEVSNKREAELDVSAVLREYIRQDRDLTERAKDTIEIRNLPQSAMGRTKRLLADKKGFGLGEDAVGWICTQLLETFMQSAHVDEVFATDGTLIRKMKNILVKNMDDDDTLDKEVRSRIKNIEQGTSSWEIEYQKVMEQIKSSRGLEE